MNRLVLHAQLAERGALRYTPAGAPALDAQLAHQGQQTEAGSPRKVALQLRAVAIGEVAQALGAMPLGTHGNFAGFLAGTRNGRGLLFHITALQPDPNESTDS
jgi:primosomal replication protein N